MSMTKVRSREVFLLVLPVVLLGAVGWYLSHRPMSRDSGPLRMVIDETKVLPANPREVYEGYDTKAVITVHSEGRYDAPADWRLVTFSPASRDVRLVAVKNGKEKVLFDGTRHNKSVFRVMNNMGSAELEVICWLKLAVLPHDVGELRITGNVTNSFGYNIGRGPGRSHQRIDFKPTPFEVTVKKSDERVVAPKVSLEQPFEVVEAKATEMGSEFIISLAVRPTRNTVGWGKKPRIYWSRIDWEKSAYFADQKGRRYSRFKDSTGVPEIMRLSTMAISGEGGIYRVQYSAPARQLPKGRLTFHTTVSVNECWPLPIEVVVREK
jgi:hypothetical protein